VRTTEASRWARSSATGPLAASTMTRTRGLVPLRTVADIQMGSGPVQIDRYDRARQVTLSANPDGLPLGGATSLVQGPPVMKNPPARVGRVCHVSPSS